MLSYLNLLVGDDIYLSGEQNLLKDIIDLEFPLKVFLTILSSGVPFLNSSVSLILLPLS